MDWWEEQQYLGWKIHAVPVQHWSGRKLWDHNQFLWPGWVLEHPKFLFFFAGDTGYSKDFIDLGKNLTASIWLLFPLEPTAHDGS